MRVSGNLQQLSDFKRIAKGENGDLDFHSFIPYPDKFKIPDDEYWGRFERGESTEGLKDGYNNGGYEWKINNWGTKWNARHLELEEKPRSLIYVFDTAWSPPLPIIFKMSQMFDGLFFILDYREDGMCFKGKLKVRNSYIIYDKEF